MTKGPGPRRAPTSADGWFDFPSEGTPLEHTQQQEHDDHDYYHDHNPNYSLRHLLASFSTWVIVLFLPSLEPSQNRMGILLAPGPYLSSYRRRVLKSSGRCAITSSSSPGVIASLSVPITAEASMRAVSMSTPSRSATRR